MFKLLVGVDRSLEASFALRTACLFGGRIHIQPIYVFDPPGRDMTLGAGWAWKSWERETRRQAQEDIEDLVVSERNQCANIQQPIISMGDAVHEITNHFWRTGYDLLVVGTPFRESGPLTLGKQFWQAAKKNGRDLPLLIVGQLKMIHEVIALTDGSAPAESAIDLMIRMNAFLSLRITVIGLDRYDGSNPQAEALHLERGLAILKEKGIDADSETASALNPGKLSEILKTADLVVSPFRKDDHHFFGLSEKEVRSALFYMSRI